MIKNNNFLDEITTQSRLSEKPLIDEEEDA